VGSLAAGADLPDFDTVVGDTSGFGILAHGRADEMEMAVRALTQGSADLAVVGSVELPRRSRRSTAPAIDPHAVAISRTMLEEVGGVPPGPDPVGLHRRVEDAGGRIAIVPVTEASRLRPRRRDVVEAPTAVILAAVPMHDIGGGSRAARIAVELVSRGFHVVHAAVFGANESVDLGLRFIHPHLEQYRVTQLGVANLEERIGGPGLVLVEVPHPSLLGPVSRLREEGWTVVYDVIDRWEDHALGGDWYRSGTEAAFLSIADTVVASSRDLVDRVGSMGERAASCIPNAVDEALFSGPPPGIPDDFPPGDGAVIGYHGSLYGNWIDWQAIVAVARANPAARVVLIGDAGGATGDLPGNVHLLGLKPQHRLAAYLHQFDVGLVPFTVSETTHAVSPLKVYEYLACGVPVASPPLRALEGLDGVFTADRLVDAVALAMTAGPPDRAAILRDHSWSARVGALLAAAGVSEPAVEGSRPEVAERAVVHYSRGERAV
jgi:glycosyltransferase involved in cell wall biosynthesis